LDDLLSLFSARQIVLDGSLPAYRREQLCKACDVAGIPYTSLYDKGFVDFRF
jgi:hypothetical protein